MHDLRKKILLESGKTTSRKAQSRPQSNRASATHSPVTSPPSSRGNSRPGSRYASDAEDSDFTDSEFDDSLTVSTDSAPDDAGSGLAHHDSWEERLRTHVAHLQDRKRSSVQGRVANLKGYLHLARYNFARAEIARSFDDMVAVLLKSIKGGGSAEERALALKSLAVTLLTCPSESAYDGMSQTLRAACRDDEDDQVKAEAVSALGVAALYGGGSEAEASSLAGFLIDIVESDGQAVEAEDSAAVVMAALQTWGFVASYLDDLGGQSEAALEAFVEQLESTDSDVQAAAGANIALLYEAAREHEEETGEALPLPYDARKLVNQMKALGRGSKSISKRSRRHVRTTFASVVTSLERGTGPGYFESARPEINPHTGGAKADRRDGAAPEYGYREKVRVRDTIMTIDTWALMARMEMLVRVLGGGFSAHFLANPTVDDILDGAEVEVLTGWQKSNHKRLRR